MKSLAAYLLTVILAGCTSSRVEDASTSHTHPLSEEVKKAMRTVVIPSVKLSGTPVNEAIIWWTDAGRKHNVDGIGFSTMAQTGNSNRLISVSEQNMNLLDLLNEICRQAELIWWVESRYIFISTVPATEQVGAGRR